MSYVTDYTGKLPANLISNELLTIYNLNGTEHFVLTPANAPFFLTNLIVKRTYGGVTTTLVEGQHYWPALLFIGATRATGIPTYGCIYIEKSISTGVFDITYQTVGSTWVLDPLDVQNNLTSLSTDPRVISWETANGLPVHFDANVVPWTTYNKKTIADVVAKINEIDAAIIASNAASSTPTTLKFTNDATGQGTSNITLTLRPTGIIPGTYTKFTVDEKGRIADASEVRSLADLGIAIDYATQEGLDFTLANEVVQLSHIGTGGSVHAVATTTTDGFMSPADKIKLNKASIFSLTSTAAAALAATASPGISSEMARYDHVHPLIPVATTTDAGLMSAADKVKLNGIAAGAQANAVTSVNTHIGSVTLSITDFALNNVNNTSDVDKPVSTAFQTELNTKQVKLFDYTDTEAVILALDATALSGKVAKCTDTLKEYVSDGTDWIEVLNSGGGASSYSTDLARKPIPLSPANNAIGQNGDLTLTANAYAPMYDSDTRIERQFQVTLATDTAFANIVYSGASAADSHSVTTNLDRNTAYIWRCRDKYNTIVSGATTTKNTAWSTAWKFTTANVVIDTPTFTSITGEPNDVTEDATIVMSAFNVSVGSETHLSTTWKIYDSTNTLIYTNANDTINLTSWTIPYGVLSANSDYTFKVTYNGDHFNSSAASKTINTETTFAYGNYLVVGSAGATVFHRYGVSVDTFTRIGSDAGAVGASCFGANFSSDGNYLLTLAKNGGTPKFAKRTKDSFGGLSGSFPTVVGVVLTAAATSNDGSYIAWGYDTSPFIKITKRTGTTLATLSGTITQPPGAVQCMAFSHDGVYLAVGHSVTPYITIYKRSGDTFTKLPDPAALPTAAPGYCVFNRQDTLLAFSGATYSRLSDTFTKIASTVSGAFSFSPDGNYLATKSGSTFVLKSISGTTFTTLVLANTPLANTALANANCAGNILFSPDGKKLAIQTSSSTFSIYNFETGALITSPVYGHIPYTWYQNNHGATP